MIIMKKENILLQRILCVMLSLSDKLDEDEPVSVTTLVRL